VIYIGNIYEVNPAGDITVCVSVFLDYSAMLLMYTLTQLPVRLFDMTLMGSIVIFK